MEDIQDITLDISTNQAYTVVSTKQGDNNTRGIHVHYTRSGEAYAVNLNNSVALRVRKPDGHVIFNDAQVQNDGSVIAMFTYQTLIKAGRAYADLIEFNSQGQTLSTVSFILNIMSSPEFNADAALSSDEFLYLKAFIDRGNGIVGEAQEWANGYNGDTPVSSDNPAYENNAKYWSEQAQVYAESGGYDAQAWAVGSRGSAALPSSDPAYFNHAKYWAAQASFAATTASQYRDNIYDMTVSAVSTSSNPTVTKTISSNGTVNLNFGLPKGDIGDAIFVSFDINYEDGNLYMFKPQPASLLNDISFSVNSNTGNLEVSVQ